MKNAGRLYATSKYVAKGVYTGRGELLELLEVLESVANK